MLKEQEIIRMAVAAEGAEPNMGSLLPRQRRNAYRGDSNALEAIFVKRYEVFCQPEVVRMLF